MDDLFHKILVYLYNQNGLNTRIDITDFLKEAFHPHPDSPEVLRRILDTMGRLGVSGYIDRDHLPNWGKNTNQVFHTLDTDKASAVLTLMGHTYIADKIRQSNQDALLARQTDVAEKTGSSVVSTNEFTVTNAKKNNNLFWLTFAVAVISAFGTVGGCFISYRQQTQQRKQASQDTLLLQIQNRQLQSDSVLSFQQGQIDSLMRILIEPKVDTPKTPVKPNISYKP